MSTPRICPDCKGTGGVYSTSSELCKGCPKENCGGAWDNPTCNCLYHRCGTCRGTGMLGVKDAPVVYKSPFNRTAEEMCR